MIKAVCKNCDYEHNVSNRIENKGTIYGKCPKCRSIRAKLIKEEKSTKEKIRTELEETNGVHPVIIERIEEKYDSLIELEKVSIEELKEIKGIGKKLAKRIHNSG